jgi:hypothetical protein
VRLALSRRAHRFIAIASAVFLVSSAGTGLLWAFSPYLYLDEGYMRKKAPMSGPAPTAAVVTVQDAMAAARKAGRSGPVQQATLRSDFGRLLWASSSAQAAARLSVFSHGRRFRRDAVAADGRAGDRHRPAVCARQSARRGVVAESGFVGRSDRARPAPAYRVRFKQARNPEIVIHRDSGVILADEDSARRFHFLVTQLHQYNYFGFKKTLTAIAGVPLLLLIGTGLVMWIRPKLRRARRGLTGAGATT